MKQNGNNQGVEAVAAHEVKIAKGHFTYVVVGNNKTFNINKCNCL